MMIMMICSVGLPVRIWTAAANHSWAGKSQRADTQVNVSDEDGDEDGGEDGEVDGDEDGEVDGDEDGGEGESEDGVEDEVDGADSYWRTGRASRLITILCFRLTNQQFYQYQQFNCSLEVSIW